METNRNKNKTNMFRQCTNEQPSRRDTWISYTDIQFEHSTFLSGLNELIHGTNSTCGPSTYQVVTTKLSQSQTSAHVSYYFHQYGQS